jgi:hypothetical protein
MIREKSAQKLCEHAGTKPVGFQQQAQRTGKGHFLTCHGRMQTPTSEADPELSVVGGLKARTEQVPSVAFQVEEYRDPAVQLASWR